MLNEDAILAVKKGADYMDENYPGWASLINFETFEMDNCHQCVVGQAVGEYGHAIGLASGQKPYSREASEWAAQYGFDVPMEDFAKGDDHVYQCYVGLETLWTDQVRERLG